MNYVNPIVTIHTANTLKGGLELAEFAGRLCYKSENKVTSESYKDFLLMRIGQGHTSILEHCPIYIHGYLNEASISVLNIKNSSYSRYITEKYDNDLFHSFIYSNLRVVYDANPYLAKKLICSSTNTGDEIWKAEGVSWFIPNTNDRYTRISAYIITLRSIVDELVRERIFSDAVESTRWCDYCKDKFKGITFCLPHWIDSNEFDICFKEYLINIKEASNIKNKLERLMTYASIAFDLYKKADTIDRKRAFHYIRCCVTDELFYNEAKDELNLQAQDAREYLPLTVKSEIYYTGYNRDWDNLLKKRLYDIYGKAHENMHVIMNKCLDHLNSIRKS